MDIAGLIRNVPDFPKPGIQFKDITTLLLKPEAFRHIVDSLKQRYETMDVDAIIGVDARGFIFGGALAYAMGLPFVPARKKGKLPAECVSEEFQLEYGTDIVELHVDAVHKGQRVVVVDDLLATGGTAAAVARLAQRLGAEVVEIAFVIELPPLNGRKRLSEFSVHSFVEFMVE